MRIIARSTIREFCGLYPDSTAALKSWFHEVNQANWNNPMDIKAQYGSASILKQSRVVFNICGNKYRLVCALRYDKKILYIKFIGTHAEYDEIDAEEYNGPKIKGHKE